MCNRIIDILKEYEGKLLLITKKKGIITIKTHGFYVPINPFLTL